MVAELLAALLQPPYHLWDCAMHLLDCAAQVACTRVTEQALAARQSQPWQEEGGSDGDPELQATLGDDTLSDGQAEALGSGSGSPAPQLRRSLEAALAEAGRGSDPNPVAQPDPAHAEQLGAGPLLFSLPAPPSRRPGSVGDALDAQRYSPADEGALIGAGAGQSTDADATPGNATAGGRAVGGGAANLGLAFGSPGSGSPVAAPLSPATVQRHMRTYNIAALADAEDEGEDPEDEGLDPGFPGAVQRHMRTYSSVALADAEDEGLDPEDEGLDPGSPGGRGGASGGYPRSDLGRGWRDAQDHEDGGTAGKGPGGV